MNPVFVKTFNKGLITRIEDKDIARGAASDCLNWHFLGDHIELRRGQKLLGTEIAGSGRVSGLRVIERHDGMQFPFYTYSRKLNYYTVSTDTTTEISTDLLPSAADGEDIAIEQYNSLAGNMAYISSPNSSIYKIPAANPGSVTDLLMQEFRGKIKIKQSRMFLWDRKDDFGGSDQSGLYLSHIDGTDNIYAFTKQEQLGTGDGATTSFSGTLAYKASNAKETCFFVVIAGATTAPVAITAISSATAGVVTSAGHGLSVGDTVVFTGVAGMTQINDMIGVVTAVASSSSYTVNIDTTNFTAYSSDGTGAKAERFVDDRSGNLSSPAGGTGTINYSTGAYSVTFTSPVINSSKVVSQYFREDSTKISSGDGGIANFDFSGTRTAGEGAVFRQDDRGGKFMASESYGNAEYCLHESKTWVLTLGSDDTSATNLIYRENVGIPYWRAAKTTGNGIVYVDAIGENPAVRVLDFGRFLNEVVPKSISDALDLRSYEFDYALIYEWGDYLIMACRTNTETINNRVFLYHKIWKTWEVHSFRVSVLDTLNGALMAGDSGSNNIFKLFSGLTDEESRIENYFITNDDFLNKEGVKKCNRMMIAGLIGIDQSMKVSYSVDNGPFSEILAADGTSPLIIGNESYVDLNDVRTIGALTLGQEQIGGGQDPEGVIEASPYELEFRIGTEKFENIRLKFEAAGIGYLSVSEYGFVDLRDKGRKVVKKYQQ